jgi:BolA protein
MTRADRIKASLTKAFSPVSLEVVDESHLHAGHAGARPEGETHFRVSVTAAAFEGVNRVERQRLVNQALAEEFESGLHALSIRALAPAEARLN